MILQKQYNISYDRLQTILNKYTKEKVSSAKRHNYTILENYFSFIDSRDKAYWLGWLISDGAITYQPDKSKYQIELTIKKEDQNILYLLANDLGVPHNVYDSGINYKRLSLGCKKMVEDLIALGITQNKSFSVKIPKIPEQFYPNLILGLFDGDGGYTLYKRKSGQINRELSFCGNEYVVSWIRNILLKEIKDLKPKAIECERSIKRIRWGSIKDIKLIYNYMYQNCGDHYLQRKKDLIYADTEVNN